MDQEARLCFWKVLKWKILRSVESYAKNTEILYFQIMYECSEEYFSNYDQFKRSELQGFIFLSILSPFVELLVRWSLIPV